MISVAYNLPQPVEPVCDPVSSSTSGQPDDFLAVSTAAECQADSSVGSEVIVFLSLITPVDEPDELAWIKWPMLGFGVAAFLLFKIFYPGTKIHSKIPANSRFTRTKQVGTPFRGQDPADITGELRRELDQLNSM
jgi:hypothetical protein